MSSTNIVSQPVYPYVKVWRMYGSVILTMNKLNCRRVKDITSIRSDILRFLIEMMEDNYQGRKIKELPGKCPNNIYFSLKYCRNLKATLPKAPPPPDWREIYRIEKKKY